MFSYPEYPKGDKTKRNNSLLILIILIPLLFYKQISIYFEIQFRKQHLFVLNLEILSYQNSV